MYAIEIKHLGKVFTEGKKALDDISLVVPQGSIFWILRPKWCGENDNRQVIEWDSKTKQR